MAKQDPERSSDPNEQRQTAEPAVTPIFDAGGNRDRGTEALAKRKIFEEQRAASTAGKQPIPNETPTQTTPSSDPLPDLLNLDLLPPTETDTNDPAHKFGRPSKRRKSPPISLTLPPEPKSKPPLSGMSVEQLERAVKGRPSELKELAANVAQALAQLPTVAAGLSAEGFHKGWLLGVAETEQQLQEIRGPGAVRQEISRGARVLARNAWAIDLIEAMKAHGYLEGVNDPQQAIKESATFLHAVSNTLITHANKENRLTKIELDTLKLELAAREKMAVSMGAQIFGPVAGGVAELLGGIPVEVSRRLLLGMIEVLNEASVGMAKMPTNIVLATVIYPLQGALDQMRDMADDMTPERAVGAATIAVPSAVMAILLGTNVIYPNASLSDKAVVYFGSEFFVFVPLAVSAFLITALITGNRRSEKETDKPIEGNFTIT